MWYRSPSSGDQFCTGGARSGELCGWTVDQSNVNVTYDDGTVVQKITIGTKGTSGGGVIAGDSGGPVYTVRSDGKVAAKGIISGSGSSWGAYKVYFTDIWDAYYGLPGYLVMQ
ncbi:MAG: S1 family peptidase [Propionibacteriaceae bacterium]|jgi:hypothetical protein|nr:S1 family peptidase [Propionibacteriaceae bacterium]